MDERKAKPRLRFEEDRPASKLRHAHEDAEQPATVSERAHAQQVKAVRKGYAKPDDGAPSTASEPAKLRFEDERPQTALRHESEMPDDADVPRDPGTITGEGQTVSKARDKTRFHAAQRAPAPKGGKVKAKKGETSASSPRLRFEDDRAKPPSRLRHTPTSALKGTLHEQFDEQRDDNAGVSAAHEGERLAENAAGTLGRTVRNTRAHAQQKQAIRRGYAMAKSGHAQTGAAAKATAQAVLSPSDKAGRMVGGFARNHRGKAIWLLLGVMLCFIMNSLSACAPLIQSGIQAIIAGTYPAEEADILAAERAYCAMEDALQDELDNYGLYHPEYDEVEIEQMDIWHDPYVLISLVSAHCGDAWTIDDAYPFLELLFKQQYELTEDVTSEQRYQTIDGEQVWFTRTTCKVKLVNKNLSHLPFLVLSREQVGIYAMYMSTLGNMPDLFAGNPHASELKDPMLYDVPEEYLTADPSFAKLIAEAEKYIGYPYVWGGDSPETSFDCSGFISWIFVQTGVRNVGRLGATGLYGACTPIQPEEARPGDLIFFSGTLGDGVDGNDGITHVGLYVGDGMMIHCGNPISYADLSRTYWQQHFYGFGRMY